MNRSRTLHLRGIRLGLLLGLALLRLVWMPWHLALETHEAAFATIHGADHLLHYDGHHHGDVDREADGHDHGDDHHEHHPGADHDPEVRLDPATPHAPPAIALALEPRVTETIAAPGRRSPRAPVFHPPRGVCGTPRVTRGPPRA